MSNTSRKTKFQIWVVCLLIGLPLAVGGGYLCFRLAEPWFFYGGGESRSATGRDAVERAEKVLGDIQGGEWKAVASNARAEWTEDDFFGDSAQYFAFNLPLDEIPTFEEAVRTLWSKSSAFRGPDQIQSMPTANDEPQWFNERLEDAVYYQLGIMTIGISQTTGRVHLRVWES